MLKVLGDNTILLNKGDTAYLHFTFLDPISKDKFSISENDKVTFEVTRRVDKTVLLSLDITNGYLKINSEDSDLLECGTYLFDIKIRYENGDTETSIADSKLIIF